MSKKIYSCLFTGVSRIGKTSILNLLTGERHFIGRFGTSITDLKSFNDIVHKDKNLRLYDSCGYNGGSDSVVSDKDAIKFVLKILNTTRGSLSAVCLVRSTEPVNVQDENLFKMVTDLNPKANKIVICNKVLEDFDDVKFGIALQMANKFGISERQIGCIEGFNAKELKGCRLEDYEAFARYKEPLLDLICDNLNENQVIDDSSWYEKIVVKIKDFFEKNEALFTGTTEEELYVMFRFAMFNEVQARFLAKMLIRLLNG